MTRRWTALILAGGFGVGIAATVIISIAAGTSPYLALGNTDPGAVIRIGTPLLRLVCDLAATLCVGSLAFASCFTRPKDSGLLSSGGYAAVRDASRWALVWVIAALLLVVFDTADTSGQTLSDVLSPAHLFGLIGALEETKAWLVTAVLAAVVAIAGRTALRWRSATYLLPVAVLGLLPALATGHSSSDAGHDIATVAIMVHVPVAAVWIGVLVALLRQVRRDRGALPVIAPRYARLALICWLLLAVSGVVDTLILASPGELLSSGYGLLIIVKLGIFALLGAVALVLRRRALARLDTSTGRVGWLRLAAGELVVLLGTVGVSVGLTHLPPPAFLGHAVTAQETLIGFNLSGPPTVLRLLTDWRIDAFFGPLAVLLALGYLVGVLRLRKQGGAWPLGRTASWLGGCVVLVLATCSGIGRYAEAQFSMHIANHMLVGMLVPALLVLGGPLTLLRRTLPPVGTGGLLDLRGWLRAMENSPPVRVLTQPMVVLVLFLGSPFLLYFSGLYDAAVRFHWAHLAISVCFLVIGLLFFWPIIGVDDAPRPLPNLARLGMLLAAMPFDTVFAAILLTTHQVIGNGDAGDNMYSSLGLPWVHNLLADQRLAGILALILGEASLLVAVIALLVHWTGLDERGADSGLLDYQPLLDRLNR
ncbi:MAG TPA: cytochrome c oxidase assembly protein [Pseudonocardiaceae bacterium]|nr:cytochrome c oxidase assembly protein [Pseudonocardiaceae bacterium]